MGQPEDTLTPAKSTAPTLEVFGFTASVAILMSFERHEGEFLFGVELTL